MSPPSQFPPERSAHEADAAPRRGASSWPVSRGVGPDAAKAAPATKGYFRKAIVVSALGVSALGAGGLVSSCFASSDGLAPPTNIAYFPTALVISKGRTTLYVANSDFDLQYSGGTVQALDLGSADGLRTRARALAVAIAQGKTQADSCAAIGTKVNGEDFVHPGPCAALPLGPFVKKFATVGAFSSQGLIVDRTDGQPGARLFLTVRGDPSVTYFDVVDDRNPDAPVSPCGDAFCLDCGGTGVGKRCASSHLIGTNPFDNLRGIKLPTEPTGIDVVELGGTSGDPLVIAHQTTNQVSLVVNRWPDQGPSGPTLEFSLGSLADGPVDVVHIPQPGIVKASNGKIDYRPGFIVSHRAAAELSVVRYEDDARAAPGRPFLTKTQSIPLTLSA